jgi:Zn2+/Cd2+-exporting ATPase
VIIFKFFFLYHSLTHSFVHTHTHTIGTLVAVRPGDKIPIDGVVKKGESTVDESNLTGESRPITKKVGDDVSAGTINVGLGYLVVRTTELSENSAVAKLVELVSQAQAERSPTEKYVERVAKIYTPIVILVALCAATIPWTYVI